MKKSLFTTATLVASAMFLAGNAFAQDSEAQRTLNENMRNANEAYKQLQREREREQMRDKSHDFPRMPVGKDISIGGSLNPSEVNIRKTY